MSIQSILSTSREGVSGKAGMDLSIVRSGAIFAICMLGIMLSPPAASADTFPLVDGFWSTDCANAGAPTVQYVRSNSADFASTHWVRKQEAFKSHGRASFNQADKTWSMTDNTVGQDQLTKARRTVIRISSDRKSYSLLEFTYDGKTIVSKGIELNTGKAAPPRFRCDSSSASYAANVPTYEEWRTQNRKISFPAPPAAMARSANATSRPDGGTGTSSQDRHPSVLLIQESNAAAESGDFITACEKSRQAIRSLQESETSARVQDFVKKINGLGYCQKANQQERAIGEAFVAALMNPAECGDYKRAKQTCAPAADFPACMKRLGLGSDLTRAKCASGVTADGW